MSEVAFVLPGGMVSFEVRLAVQPVRSTLGDHSCVWLEERVLSEEDAAREFDLVGRIPMATHFVSLGSHARQL